MVGNTAVAAALDRLAATVREQHQSMAEQYSGLRGDLEHFGKPLPAAAPKVGTAEHLVAAEAAARRLAERRLREAAADASAREQTIQELRETLERTKLDAAEELRRLTFQLRLTQDELADAKRQLDEQADEMVVLRQREGEANRAAEAAKDDLEALSETMSTAAAQEARLRAKLEQRDAELASRDAELASRDAELASRDAELAELAAALESERQASARPSLSASLRSEVSDVDTSASASVAGEPSVVSGKPKRKARLGLPSLMRRRPSASAAAPATALAAATATAATTATIAGADAAASAAAAVTAAVTASVAAVDPRLDALMAKVAAEPSLVGTTRSDAARVLAEQGGHVGKAFNELQLVDRIDQAFHKAPSGGLATASATAKAASRFSFGLGRGKK
jgi:myosin heavy subunit